MSGMKQLNDNITNLTVKIAKLSTSVDHQVLSSNELKLKVAALELCDDDQERRLIILETYHTHRAENRLWWSNNWHKIFQTVIVVVTTIAIGYGAYINLNNSVKTQPIITAWVRENDK